MTAFSSETFEIDYAVALIFTLTQPNSSAQRTDKQIFLYHKWLVECAAVKNTF
jgi:hypothetical protein